MLTACWGCTPSFSLIPAANAVQLLSPAPICSFERAVDSISPAAFAKLTTVLGAAIFAFGSVHQAKCHRILAELKASCRLMRAGNRRRYGIPRGSWFEFCSCAHYLVRGFEQRTDGLPTLFTTDVLLFRRRLRS